MKALRHLRRQESLSNNAHDILQLLSRQPRRQFITSWNRTSSGPTTSPFAPFKPPKAVAPKPGASPLARRPLRLQRQSRLKSTKSASPHQPPHSATPSPNPTPTLNSPAGSENLSLSQRLRKLSREYGWSALGVYLLLSALDFPFCFAAVRMLGVERIGHWEHVIVNGVKQIVTYPFPEGTFGTWGPRRGREEGQPVAITPVPAEGSAGVAEPGEAAHEWSWGVEEADEANKKGATIWTQLALAYAIHKSFIFVRVPLAAAVTPKVVKVLRSWGWNIGKRRPKPQA